MITAQPSTSGGWRDYDFWVFCVSVESCWKIGEGTSRRNRYKNFLQPTKANHGILVSKYHSTSRDVFASRDVDLSHTLGYHCTVRYRSIPKFQRGKP